MLNGGRMEGIIDGKTASEIEMLNNDYNNNEDENNNNKKNVKKKQRNMEYGNNVSF